MSKAIKNLLLLLSIFGIQYSLLYALERENLDFYNATPKSSAPKTVLSAGEIADKKIVTPQDTVVKSRPTGVNGQGAQHLETQLAPVKVPASLDSIVQTKSTISSALTDLKAGLTVGDTNSSNDELVLGTSNGYGSFTDKRNGNIWYFDLEKLPDGFDLTNATPNNVTIMKVVLADGTTALFDNKGNPTIIKGANPTTSTNSKSSPKDALATVSPDAGDNGFEKTNLVTEAQPAALSNTSSSWEKASLDFQKLMPRLHVDIIQKISATFTNPQSKIGAIQKTFVTISNDLIQIKNTVTNALKNLTSSDAHFNPLKKLSIQIKSSEKLMQSLGQTIDKAVASFKKKAKTMANSVSNALTPSSNWQDMALMEYFSNSTSRETFLDLATNVGSVMGSILETLSSLGQAIASNEAIGGAIGLIGAFAGA